jgi:hypothetical protein
MTSCKNNQEDTVLPRPTSNNANDDNHDSKHHEREVSNQSTSSSNPPCSNKWSLQDDNSRPNQQQVYNTAIVTIAATSSSNHTLLAPPPPSLISSSMMENSSNHIHRCDVFTIHRDEFDVHLLDAIPMRTALNLFERQRSNWLGGPFVLKRMLTEYNLQWVVTSIDDLEIYRYSTTNNTHHTSYEPCKTDVMIKPGMEVEVRSSMVVKRRGMILEFPQEVLSAGPLKEENDCVNESVVLARGVVTICAIDGKKGKPTRNIPQEVKKILSI